MSVKRRDLVRYFEKNGFYMLREGGKHTIYTNGKKVLPVKRHKMIKTVKLPDNILELNSCGRELSEYSAKGCFCLFIRQSCRRLSETF